MLKPEVFTLPYDLLIKGSKEDCIDYLDRVCICEHRSFIHGMQHYKQPDYLAERVAFFKCEALRCPCEMFRQDNLKYLEAMALRNGY